MLLMQFGSMGKDLAAYNTKLFAERVLPNLRGLFSEWEDKWWPQPMARSERAEVPGLPVVLGRRIAHADSRPARNRPGPGPVIARRMRGARFSY